jgi:pyrroline-5-carboxylate reductase
MKKFNPKLIMIDVDGTLVDSVPDLAYCVDELMATLLSQRELEFGVEVFTDNSQMVMQCDAVVLAVKPQILPSVCKQIKTHTHHRPLMISSAICLSSPSATPALVIDSIIKKK